MPKMPKLNRQLKQMSLSDIKSEDIEDLVSLELELESFQQESFIYPFITKAKRAKRPHRHNINTFINRYSAANFGIGNYIRTLENSEINEIKKYNAYLVCVDIHEVTSCVAIYLNELKPNTETIPILKTAAEYGVKEVLGESKAAVKVSTRIDLLKVYFDIWKLRLRRDLDAKYHASDFIFDSLKYVLDGLKKKMEDILNVIKPSTAAIAPSAPPLGNDLHLDDEDLSKTNKILKQ